MISKALFYYTQSGKTEAAIDKEKINGVDIFKLNNLNPSEVNFEPYDIIIIGTPTYGRGVPPLYFKELLPKLFNLKSKKIGLFGSGNTIYGDDFCGALDLLEEILEKKNDIVFKYKFEGMPRLNDTETIYRLIMGVN